MVLRVVIKRNKGVLIYRMQSNKGWLRFSYLTLNLNPLQICTTFETNFSNFIFMKYCIRCVVRTYSYIVHCNILLPGMLLWLLAWPRPPASASPVRLFAENSPPFRSLAAKSKRRLRFFASFWESSRFISRRRVASRSISFAAVWESTRLLWGDATRLICLWKRSLLTAAVDRSVRRRGLSTA
jgi:hypothetical protein